MNEGSCHCGAIRLTLPSTPTAATECNCSLCRRIGGVWAYFEFGTVRVDAEPGAMGEYAWGDRTLRTMRCSHCGIVTHWEPLDPKPGAKHGVNLRNFSPALLASVAVRKFDGADSWKFFDQMETVVRPLARHRELLPVIERWFEQEWPDHYGPGGPGRAAEDLLDYANEDGLPVGLVAFRSDTPVGFLALKREAFPTHPHLAPWVGAACVLPAVRRQGIGRALFQAAEQRARALGFRRIYCATGTAASLLLRSGWSRLDLASHDGQSVGIYDKALEP